MANEIGATFQGFKIPKNIYGTRIVDPTVKRGFSMCGGTNLESFGCCGSGFGCNECICYHRTPIAVRRRFMKHLMMALKVTYFVGKGFTGKEKHLYLWRSQNATMTAVARFMTADAVMDFARDFKFSLSDSVKEKLEEWMK